MHSETHGIPEARSPGVVPPGAERRARPPRHLPHTRRNPFAGPLSAPLWAKAHRVPSAYPDTFDYGIYDRLYARFGDQQPRGGVRARLCAQLCLLLCPKLPVDPPVLE